MRKSRTKQKEPKVELSNQERVDILTRAKALFEREARYGITGGMCVYIGSILLERFSGQITWPIHNYIPRFRPRYLVPQCRIPHIYSPLDLWWPEKDTQSRLEAFDKLIQYYRGES